jgi:predicted XRE-type DNA-binding protein
MHSCDNPACVNINHLSKGTHADNVADKVAKGRGISGQRHYKAKLTDDQIREIRASDMNQYELAKLYGVSQPTVSEIQNRKVWAHIQ